MKRFQKLVKKRVPFMEANGRKQKNIQLILLIKSYVQLKPMKRSLRWNTAVFVTPTCMLKMVIWRSTWPCLRA